MTELSASVGKKGSNVAADVSLVQQLLKAAGFYAGAVNGDCGADTVDAIRRFQATFTAKPDSLVEPGMRTWLRLNALAQPAGRGIQPRPGHYGITLRRGRTAPLDRREPCGRGKMPRPATEW